MSFNFDYMDDYGDMVGSGYIETVYDKEPKRPDDPVEELDFEKEEYDD